MNLLGNKTDYGEAISYDTSRWSYKRPYASKRENNAYIYNCSRTVCNNAQLQPFKYVCKYFNISINEESLEYYENMLNDFEAAVEGIKKLENKKGEIRASIDHQIPYLIKKFNGKRLEKELGFLPVPQSIPFPKYEFRYVSPGGNASLKSVVYLNIKNLNGFVQFLADKIKFRKSAAGQRALMTSALRYKIKERDNYTCQICGNSTY